MILSYHPKEIVMLDNFQLSFIASIKEKIRLAQYEALKTVNTHLINLYWDIGKDISGRQSESWGKSIVPVLSKELQKEFPGISGFSVSNLWYMAQFYSEYRDVEFLEPLVREISWSKHIAIMKKCKDNQERRGVPAVLGGPGGPSRLRVPGGTLGAHQRGHAAHGCAPRRGGTPQPCAA
jgi:predicted nuclease of restriction endonuclease-like (RecB) superfamily